MAAAEAKRQAKLERGTGKKKKGANAGSTIASSEIAPLVDESSQDELAWPPQPKQMESERRPDAGESERVVEELPLASNHTRRDAETSKPASNGEARGATSRGSQVVFGSTARDSPCSRSRQRRTGASGSPASTDSDQLVVFGSVSRRVKSESQTAPPREESASASGVSRAHGDDSSSSSRGVVHFGRKTHASSRLRGEANDDAEREGRLLSRGSNMGERSSGACDFD